MLIMKLFAVYSETTNGFLEFVNNAGEVVCTGRNYKNTNYLTYGHLLLSDDIIQSMEEMEQSANSTGIDFQLQPIIFPEEITDAATAKEIKEIILKLFNKIVKGKEEKNFQLLNYTFDVVAHHFFD